MRNGREAITRPDPRLYPAHSLLTASRDSAELVPLPSDTVWPFSHGVTPNAGHAAIVEAQVRPAVDEVPDIWWRHRARHPRIIASACRTR